MDPAIPPTTTSSRWTLPQTRAQFAAIAWLRWRIVANSMRRKGATSDLIAMLIVAPLFGLLALAVSGVTGWGAFHFTQVGELQRISWLLWGTFAICQFLNINVGQPGTIFDPTQLIRFPLRSGNYILIRLFFGILSPANVMVAVMSLAIAIGITMANPALWVYAFLSMAIFAVTNAIFTRMVFAWVDRWLSTRRAREVFTGLIFAFSLTAQWVNVRFNLSNSHHHRAGVHQPMTHERMDAMQRTYHHLQPLLDFFPPGLVGRSLMAAAHGHPVWFMAYAWGCVCFGLVFFAIFAARTRTEFRGEVFSDAANAVSAAPRMATRAATQPVASRSMDAVEAPSLFSKAGAGALRLSPAVAAVFGKEILSIRRNTGVFYALVAPVVMVFLFAGRMAARNTPNSIYIFPGALAYALVGIVPLAFNSFGLEGPGSQLYFLLPVRLRDVFVAKNLVNFLLAYAETAAVLAIVTYLTGLPTLNTMVTSILWAVGTLLITTTFGNRRSITAPKKIDPGRTASKQASPASAFLGMGLLLVSASLGFGAMALTRYLGLLWVMPLAMAAFTLIGAAIYLTGLRGIERFTMAHREELFEELCKEASSSVRR
jgi:ABC-2 type transport system permease protein